MSSGSAAAVKSVTNKAAKSGLTKTALQVCGVNEWSAVQKESSSWCSPLSESCESLLAAAAISSCDESELSCLHRVEQTATAATQNNSTTAARERSSGLKVVWRNFMLRLDCY